MPLNLKNTASDVLVDLLIRNNRYFMLLCNTGADVNQRKVAEQYIDQIINELKSREDYKDLIENRSIEISRFKLSAEQPA